MIPCDAIMNKKKKKIGEVDLQIVELALKEKAGKQRQEISGEQMNLFDFLKE